ncbi:hypothetical protein V9L05_15325 [Bernardetia sp. Wsw4-3y2]|uniref:hypothetical protein n=1 Tax=Bernardetia sp. Wsw4-3y2 TaxID=3127471 RepID=UPI0030D272FB
MNKLQLHSDKRSLQKLIPAKWDELFSLKQALVLIKLLRFQDCISLRFRVVKELFNLKFYKPSDYKFLAYLKQLQKKDLWKIIALTEFLFKKEDLPTKLFLTKINNRVCKNFDESQFWQWATADSNFLLLQKTTEEKYLNKMLACFYLKPQKEKGKIIFKFDAGEIEKESKCFEKLTFEKKQLFLLWYMGNRERLVKMYSSVFSGGKGAGNKQDFGWAGILDDLSSDITKMEEVAEIELHTVLFSLNKKIIRNEELEREYEKNNT